MAPPSPHRRVVPRLAVGRNLSRIALPDHRLALYLPSSLLLLLLLLPPASVLPTGPRLLSAGPAGCAAHAITRLRAIRGHSNQGRVLEATHRNAEAAFAFASFASPQQQQQQQQGSSAAEAARRVLKAQSPGYFGSGLQLHEALTPLWEMAARVAVNGTVLVVQASAGYTDMLENWVRHVSSVGLGSNFILFAEDEEMLRYGQSKWPGQTIHLDLPDQSLSASWQPSEAINPHSYARAGTPAFHRLTCRRILYLLHLLSFGFSVLHSHTDVALLRNPLSDTPSLLFDPKQPFDVSLTLDGYQTNWFKETRPIESYDMRRFAAGAAGGNLAVSSSFLFLHPTSGAKCLIGDWANRVITRGMAEGTDKDHLNAVISEMSAFGILPKVAVLPAQKFLSGQLLMEDNWADVEELKSGLVSVHAGGLVGQDAKRQAMKKLGFWMGEAGMGGTGAAGDAAGAAVAEAGGEEAGGGAVGGGRAGEGSGEGVGGGGAGDGAEAAGKEVTETLDQTDSAAAAAADSTWPRAGGSSSFHPSLSGGGALGGLKGDVGPFCVGVLCKEMRVSEGEVVQQAVQPWVGRHLQQIAALVPQLAHTARLVIVTSACKGQGRLFTNWFNSMHSAAMAEYVIASVPPEVETESRSIVKQPEESESEHKATLTCLLLPSLIMDQVLTLNYSVIYSDISSVWLQDPLPLLPPDFSAILPSSGPAPASQTPSPNDRSSKYKHTTALLHTDLGFLSPWFVALRPSPAIFRMLTDWGFLSLEDYREKAAAAHRDEFPFSLVASESLKVGLNEAITRMVERGERGSNVGVLSRVLFPPAWKVMGEREWFKRHRDEVVAVPNECGEDVKHREVCFRDLKLWV